MKYFLKMFIFSIAIGFPAISCKNMETVSELANSSGRTDPDERSQERDERRSPERDDSQTQDGASSEEQIQIDSPGNEDFGQTMERRYISSKEGPSEDVVRNRLKADIPRDRDEQDFRIECKDRPIGGAKCSLYEMVLGNAGRGGSATAESLIKSEACRQAAMKAPEGVTTSVKRVIEIRSGRFRCTVEW